ncbi:Myb-like DNA-binding domain-containing protein [Bacillus sp. AFS017336]|uniref:Myb-like DNA-binding domain-containing protein n=1 Tax=Bacillus sp. AFS017336 TaxID=2033489 RepID=UPI000BEFABC8|nr:Myb-like DNA-binding domain-containing protein [Bacillus sp. AFS017336]PEL14094.1 hypothetical protein CN601_00680 [Bacillus sp. AFS017336]
MNIPKSKWSIEDENTLIELVNNYESKGKSKQEAFEMVANIVNRTKAACASRYRKLSTNQSTELEEKNQIIETPINNHSLNLDIVIQFLTNLQPNTQIIEQNFILKEKVMKIKKENEELYKKIINLKMLIQKKQDVLINLAD